MWLSDEASVLKKQPVASAFNDTQLNGIFSHEGVEALRNQFRKEFKNDSQTAPQHPKLQLPNLELCEAPAANSEHESSGWTIPIGAHSNKKDVHLKSCNRPAGFPKSWKTPETSPMDGKCGLTGVSNMLRWYGVEKSPKDMDQAEYRSWGPGLRSDKFAANMRKLTGKEFSAKTIEDGTDPLDTLRGHINAGKPVAMEYMCGSTSAHWVIVTAMSGDKDNPDLTLQSWGGYYTVKFNDIKEGWKRGYGGPYPYVVGDEASKIPNR